MLNQLEIDHLQQLLSNELVLNIVKKSFSDTIENNLPKINLSDDNQKLGEKYRAYEEAKGLLNVAFLDLLSYTKTKADSVKNLNRGK